LDSENPSSHVRGCFQLLLPVQITILPCSFHCPRLPAASRRHLHISPQVPISRTHLIPVCSGYRWIRKGSAMARCSSTTLMALLRILASISSTSPQASHSGVRGGFPRRGAGGVEGLDLNSQAGDNTDNMSYLDLLRSSSHGLAGEANGGRVGSGARVSGGTGSRGADESDADWSRMTWDGTRGPELSRPPLWTGRAFDEMEKSRQVIGPDTFPDATNATFRIKNVFSLSL
jgi:hypothetical protein